MSDDAETTTINVKGMPKMKWEAARRSAIQANDQMGTWLGEAIDCRIARDSGSVKPANQPMTPEQLTARITAVAALQQSSAALKLARVRAPGSNMLRVALASLEQAIVHAEAPPVRLITGKDRAEIGKAGPWIDVLPNHPDQHQQPDPERRPAENAE